MEIQLQSTAQLPTPTTVDVNMQEAGEVSSEISGSITFIIDEKEEARQAVIRSYEKEKANRSGSLISKKEMQEMSRKKLEKLRLRKVKLVTEIRYTRVCLYTSIALETFSFILGGFSALALFWVHNEIEVVSVSSIIGVSLISAAIVACCIYGCNKKLSTKIDFLKGLEKEITGARYLMKQYKHI